MADGQLEGKEEGREAKIFFASLLCCSTDRHGNENTLLHLKFQSITYSTSTQSVLVYSSLNSWWLLGLLDDWIIMYLDIYPDVVLRYKYP